jgi:hypothetical protein
MTESDIWAFSNISKDKIGDLKEIAMDYAAIKVWADNCQSDFDNRINPDCNRLCESRFVMEKATNLAMNAFELEGFEFE